MNASSNPMSLLFLSGNGEEDESGDPRTQMMRAAVLRNMQGGADSDHGPEGESGGEVGARHIDQGTQSHPREFISSNQQSALDQVGSHLPGFDQSGMPTEYASTPSRIAAADKLQKADAAPELQPRTLKHQLLNTLLGTVPLIGPMKLGQENAGIRAARYNRDSASEEYKTEAGLEQGQREQALRERIAMQNMSLTRAMKEMIMGGQNYRAGVSADVGHERNAVGAAKSGYDISTGADGQEQINPRQTNALSEIARANIEFQQANQEYKKAQTSAIPEQLKIREEALKVANERLQLAINNAQFSQGMRREQQDFREDGPTTEIRGRSQQAGVIQQAQANLIQDLKANAGELGPIMGRYGSLTELIGNLPPKYAYMKAEMMSQIALNPAAHGFKGLRAVKEFEDAYGTPIRTVDALIAALEGGSRGLQPMAGAGQWTNLRHPQAEPNLGQGDQPSGGPASSPRQLLKKSSPNSSGGGAGKVRSVTRGKDGRLQLAP